MLKVFSSLRARVLLLIAIPFAVMFGMILYQALGNREEELVHASARVLDIARAMSGEQQRIIEHVHQVLSAEALLPELRRGVASEACNRALAARLQQEPNLDTIVLALANGDVICNAIPTAHRISLADRINFKTAIQTRKFSTSDYVISRTTGASAIGLAYPLLDEAGVPRTVVAATLSLAWLKQELTKAQLPEGARVVVVDGKGLVLARHPDPEEWIGKSAAELPLLRSILAKGGQGIEEEIGLDGRRRIFGFVPLHRTAFGQAYLWVAVPKDVVVGPAEYAFVVNLLIELTLLVLTFWAVWLAGEMFFVRRIAALAGAAEELGKGNLAARVGIRSGGDEIAGLAQSFDRMAGALQTKEQQLARANRALRVISAGNQAMLRATSEQQLIRNMCRVIVEMGGYRMAWIGYAEYDAEKTIRPVAQWGAIAEGLFENAKLTWSETEGGRTAPGNAIRSGMPVAIQDIRKVTGPEPWRQAMLRCGCGACVALPLRVGENVIGVLDICAEETGVFGNEEIGLISEAAADLSYGIAVLRGVSEQAPLRTALKTAEERLRAAAEASLDALLILKSVRDRDRNIVDFEFVDINATAEHLLGMVRDRVIGQKLRELLPMDRIAGLFDKYAQVVNTGASLEDEFAIDIPEIKAKWLRNQVVRVDDGIAISLRDITEWKAAGAQLRENEQKYRTLADAAPALIWASATDKLCNYFNQPWLKFTGRSLEQELGYGWAEGVHPDDLAQCLSAYVNAFDKREPFSLEYRLRRHDGEFRWVRDDGCPRNDSNGEFIGYLGYVLDITERKRTDLALERSVRALRTLSACNEALVRTRNEADLLNSICRLIVEIGGYRMAWVGFPEQDTGKTVRLVAQCGDAEGYLATVNISWADTELGRGPTGMAIRTGNVRVNPNFLTDPALAPWREAALKRGYQSSIALPLKSSAGIFGAITIYAPEPAAFLEDEVNLLRELADDLAFGMETLRTRVDRDRIAHEHQHHAEILRQSLEDSIKAIADTVEMRDPYTAGHQRRVGNLAVAISKELGLPEERVRGIELVASIHDLGKISVPAEILSKPGRLSEIELMLVKNHAGGIRHPQRHHISLADRRDCVAAPRTAGRFGLSARAQGRSDPARVADHGGGRRGRSDGIAPALPGVAGN